MKFKVAVSTLSTIGLLAASGLGQEDATTLLLKADQLVRQNRAEQAIDLYKKANEASGGKCAECLAGLAAAFNKLGAHKPAVDAGQKLVDLNASLEMNLRGYTEIGLAYMRKAGDDPKTLAAAEEAFRKALEISADRYSDGRFALAVILLRQKRDDEAVVLLKEFLEKTPENANAAQARQMLARPQCGRQECAPEFSLVTADGEYITHENLRGKVTVLHFFMSTDIWEQEMWPGMKRLALWTKKADSAVQIIAVSGDRDEARARAFVQRRSITWPVSVDAQQKASAAWQVTGYPYQLVINHEGIVVHRRLNWSTDQTDVLNQVISIAVGQLKKAQKTDAKDKDEKKKD